MSSYSAGISVFHSVGFLQMRESYWWRSGRGQFIYAERDKILIFYYVERYLLNFVIDSFSFMEIGVSYLRFLDFKVLIILSKLYKSAFRFNLLSSLLDNLVSKDVA